MQKIDTIAALETHYSTPAEASLVKVTDRLIPSYHSWIARSRFCVLTTIGPEGPDGSPRGDDGPVVDILDDVTLAMPDWRGNQRLDSLRNIVTDGRVSLMFFVAGSDNVIRVNGTAILTDDAELRARFEHQSIQPATVILITIAEVYSQCARAIMRAGLWTKGDQSDGLPTIGDMLKEAKHGDFDGAAYDRDWQPRAEKSLW